MIVRRFSSEARLMKSFSHSLTADTPNMRPAYPARWRRSQYLTAEYGECWGGGPAGREGRRKVKQVDGC